jgi:hypothetical protein
MSVAIDYLQMFREASQVSSPPDNSDNSDKSPPIDPIDAIDAIDTAPEDKTKTGLDDFEERAAIIEFDADVPCEWAEGFAKLCTIPRHPDYREERWQQLIDDAGWFMDRWAAQVSAMGWSIEEVFGVHYDKPDTRIDLKGLVPCIGGKEVVAVSADSVTIQSPSGNRQRIFRRPDEQSQGRVPAWDIKQELG